MDNRLKEFINVCIWMIGVLFALTFGLILFNRYSTLSTFNIIFLVLAIFIFFVALYFFAILYAIFMVFKSKKIPPPISGMVKFGLNNTMPLIVYIAGIFGKSKDSIRSLLIEINNILVESYSNKFAPEEVLILLPHCLQNSSCIYKVTNDVFNCRRCGKCCLGDICRISEETGVEVLVVTGGTAARNVIQSKKPKMILSVACERDLSSGISDVKSIPVLGVINIRENGPCYNTSVDIKKIKDKLELILKK